MRLKWPHLKMAVLSGLISAIRSFQKILLKLNEFEPVMYNHEILHQSLICQGISYFVYSTGINWKLWTILQSWLYFHIIVLLHGNYREKQLHAHGIWKNKHFIKTEKKIFQIVDVYMCVLFIDISQFVVYWYSHILYEIVHIYSNFVNIFWFKLCC